MAKKARHEEHENLERWLVSYADFITLLFAFFCDAVCDLVFEHRKVPGHVERHYGHVST